MTRRRIRTNWPLNIGIVAFTLAVAIYIAWPLITQAGWEADPNGGLARSLDAGNEMRERMIAFVAVGWFFVLGASIGSFLNVVAYRMPMGLTFVSKPSRCPFCETPIKSYHNVPILGWLVLRGRCNACRLPISARYIFVELIVGAMFLSLLLAEVASGGRNLPFREPNLREGVMWNLFYPTLDLIGIYCYHAFLLAILSTLTLIKFDRFEVPARFAFFTLAMGVALRCVWPDLCVVPAPEWMSSSVLQSQALTDSLPFVGSTTTVSLSERLLRVGFDLMIGCVVGAFVQTTIAGLSKVPFRESPCASLLVCCLVAVFCGWPALACVLLMSMLVHVVMNMVANASKLDVSRLWTASLLFGTWITLCYWRQLTEVGSTLINR